MLKRTAFLLFFLFVLMASASAQPMDDQKIDETISPDGSVEILFEFLTHGRTNTEATTTTVNEVPLKDGVVVGQIESKMEVLDKFELLKDDYFTRRPIILLQNSRAKTDD